MKELSIEQKAKAYDEALKVLHKYDGANIMFSQSLKEEMFPELKESEDERIRKALIRYFTLSDEHAYYEACGVSYRDIVAWLEKQGKQKLPIEKLPSETKTIGKSLGFTTQEDCDRYNQMISDLIMSDDDKGEQKPNDKVEPKFKVGDWMVYEENTYQIHNISLKRYYECLRTDGTVHTFDFEYIDSKSHIWTIADAKDGDILAVEYGIYIFNSFDSLDDKLFICKCAYEYSKKVFEIGGMLCGKTDVYPATREQRDLLFQKMKEASYEWDDKKKELKKIDNGEIDGEDYGIDGLWHAQRILEETLGSVDGYQSDDGILGHKAAITAVKKLYGQKHAEWSKEDMDIINGIIMDYEGEIEHLSDSAIDEQAKPIYQERINFLNRLKSLYLVKQEWSEEDDNKINSIKYLLHELDNHNFDNWLKSIKDRVQPQNLTVTDEELSQAKKDAYNDALDKIEYHSGEPTFDDGWSAAIWYLKKRNIQPQSKQEWSEEDDRILNGLISSLARIGANIRTDSTSINYTFPREINWLKSLKQRIVG